MFSARFPQLLLIAAIASGSAMESFSAPQGVIPNQTYPQSEVLKRISPQLGSRHLNQPSVINGYAIFAGNGEHEVWDISNPYQPQHVADMISHHAAGEAESHQVTYARRGEALYMATISGRGLDIWDVTDTPNPVLVSEIILPGINYGDVSGAIWGVSWQGNQIYAGATTNGLYVVDVEDIENPRLVATLSRAALGGVVAGPLFALGNLLVITSPKENRGIATVDISNPTHPRFLDGVVEGPDSYIGGFYGTNAYLITPYRVYDVTTDPRNIQLVAQADVPNSEYMSFADDHFFLGGLRGGTQGVWKYNIADPTKPQLIGRFVGRDSRWDDQFSCPVGNLLLVADDQLVDNKYVGGLVVVHSAERDTTPLHVKYVNPPDGAEQQPITTRIGISLSDWPELASVDASTFIVRPLGGQPISGTWGTTTTTLTFAPDEPLEPGTTYEIVLPADGITDLVGNALANEFRSTFRTALGGGFSGNDEIESVPPTELGHSTLFAVRDPNPARLYDWQFDDGTTLAGPSVEHTYTAAGWHFVTLNSRVNPLQAIEAEDTVFLGSVFNATENPGFTGTGYVDYPATTGAGIGIRWNVSAAGQTSASLTIRYANGGGANRPLHLVVNGGSPQVVNFPSTGPWTTYQTVVVPDVPLIAGANTIELLASAGSVGPNIDSLALSFPESDPQTISFKHLVYNPLTEHAPTASSSLALDSDRDLLWAANPDANTVTAVDLNSLTKVREVAVGRHPETLAVAPDGHVWVANRDSWSISIVSPETGSVSEIPLPYASQPFGIAFAPDGSAAYVTLQAIARVVKIGPASREVIGAVDIPNDANGIRPQIRGVAIDSTGSKIYVTRFISPSTRGEGFEINAATMQFERVLTLGPSPGPDTPTQSRGIPNYLVSMTISPDGLRAWIPSKQDNIFRGTFRDGLALDHDVTVRAIASQIDLATGMERLDARVDFDDQDRAHAVTFSPLGDLVFVAMPGNNHITVLDAYTGQEVTRIRCGTTPIATVVDEKRGRLLTLNFLSRDLSVHDISALFFGDSLVEEKGSVRLVGGETLPPDVLRGKILFYDATSTRLNSEHYMSCASCHLDGSQDGQTWDFTSLGEGLRNTIDLRGRAGMRHGRLHWTGNFDEVQDFENQIRDFGLGEGLMSDVKFHQGTRSNPLGMAKAGVSRDLDDLAAYVSSLNKFDPSPFRNPDGSLTADAIAGREIFNALRCYDCHGGRDFTDSALGVLHDVGTIKPGSGSRAGGMLTGIDTPTLRGVWSTAPYLHDGSANTLRDVLTTANPDGKHGNTATLSPTEIDQLVAYLQQIDGDEPKARPPSGVGAPDYDVFVRNFPGLSGDDALESADYDKDTFISLAEYALGGTDPTRPDSRPELLNGLAFHDGENYFTYSYLRLRGGYWHDGAYHAGDLVYRPQATDNLKTWNLSVVELPNPEGLPPAPEHYEWGTFGCLVPPEAAGGFLRMLVERVPLGDR